MSEENGQRSIAARGIAAICSLLIPGLGQLVQGRFLAAFLYFMSWILLWCCCLGWIPHAVSVVDAAVFEPKERSALR
jgi:TM2 domain-containing membrane protein YozV